MFANKLSRVGGRSDPPSEPVAADDMEATLGLETPAAAAAAAALAAAVRVPPAVALMPTAGDRGEVAVEGLRELRAEVEMDRPLLRPPRLGVVARLVSTGAFPLPAAEGPLAAGRLRASRTQKDGGSSRFRSDWSWSEASSTKWSKVE